MKIGGTLSDFNVAVNIRTMGEARLNTFEKVLEACSNQTFEDFELIVMDGEHSRRKESLCEEMGARYLVQRGRGMTNARNEAIRESEAEILAFLDDDGWPEEDWLEELLSCYEDDEVGAVGGKSLGPYFDYPWYKRLGIKIFGRSDPNRIKWFGPTTGCHKFYENRSEPFEVDWLLGMNMSVRREAIEDIGGGFDESYIMHAHCEELDSIYSIKRAGWRVVLNPGAVVHEMPGPTEEQPGGIARDAPQMLYQVGYNMVRFTGRHIVGKEKVKWIPWMVYNVFLFAVISLSWVIEKRSPSYFSIYRGALERLEEEIKCE